ncbi:unnamed protein product, partial [Symbiodinium pilosum]
MVLSAVAEMDLVCSPAYCMFIARRRKSLAEAGQNRTAAELQAEWRALSTEKKELECSAGGSERPGSAAAVMQTFLQQKEQIKARPPPERALKSARSAKHEPIPAPIFPAKRAAPEGCSREDLTDSLRRQAATLGKLPACGDLETESASFLGPRLTFDWEAEDLEEEQSAELVVTPAEGADLRDLLKK